MQDDVFEEYEGDHWFERNSNALNSGQEDMITRMIKQCGLKPNSVAELGCSNGFRLETLRQKLGAECYGVDLSAEAIADGKKKFPLLHLRHCGLADLEPVQQFDLVICNFVLHWIDRRNLLTVIRNIDKCVRWGGTVVLGDFLPDFPQKRWYHHLPDQKLYTYKQDYADIFTSSGLYNEFARFSFNHDAKYRHCDYAKSSERAVCVALRKMEDDEFYPEINA